MSTQWLSVENIAKELGLTEDTIRNYIRTKQLIAYRMGRDYRIKREDYEKFLEKRRTDKEEKE
jgi:excisionase family DNA binding protein